MLLCNNPDCEYRNECLSKKPCETCDVTDMCIDKNHCNGTHYTKNGFQGELPSLLYPLILVTKKDYHIKKKAVSDSETFETLEELLIRVDLIINEPDLIIVNSSLPSHKWIYLIKTKDLHDVYIDENNIRHSDLITALTWKSK